MIRPIRLHIDQVPVVIQCQHVYEMYPRQYVIRLLETKLLLLALAGAAN